MDVAEYSPFPAPEPLHFILQDGTETFIPPITVGQARAALRLDPDDGHQETARGGILRLAAQAEILLAPSHVYLVEVLTPVAMRELLAALYRAACGERAEHYARGLAATGQAGRPPGSYDTLRQLEAIRIELATALDKLPAEIDAMPLVTASALCDDFRRADAGKAPAASGRARF